MPVDVDPTAINIQFDPTIQRMYGVADHGNTPFDVPFVSEVAAGLWQGGCSSELQLQLPLNITDLVSLCPWERYRVTHNIRTQTYVRMYDRADTPVDMDQLHALATFGHALWQQGTLLVHCQAGLNRSSLLATAILVLDGLTGKEAVELIRHQRSSACLCNPLFYKIAINLDKEFS